MATASLFRTLVVKEIRDLIKDPKILFGMIIVPLLMYPLMGLSIRVSTEATQRSVGAGNLAVMNLDGGDLSALAVEYFRSLPNVTVNVLSPQSIEPALAETQRLNASSLVVIPPGFSANVTMRKSASVATYMPLRNLGTTESVRASIDTSLISSLASYLTAYYIRAADPGLDVSVVMRPLVLQASSYVNGEVIPVAPSTLMSMVLVQSLMMPLAMVIVVILAMQIAATAIAVEKEQKTLETLLTLPVSRFSILAAKLIGSTVIAGLGAVTSIVGFNYYMNSLTGSFERAGSVSLQLSPSPIFYVILGGLVFLSLALATSLAILVGVFAEDVRGAQAIVGYMVFPIMIPSLMIMFADLQSYTPALQALLLAIPFTYVMVFSKMAFAGDLTFGIIGLAYLLVLTVSVLYLGSRIFGSERILTARFSFGRRRRGRTSN